MKSNTIILTLFFTWGSLCSQIGINTKAPSETFDINGTARIRGLPENGTANTIFTKPDGTKSVSKDQPFTATKAIVADDNGVLGTIDLVTTYLPTVIVGGDGADVITNSKTITSTNNAAGVTPVLVTKTFTLSQKSLVTFSFNLSINDIYNSSGSLLTDGTSKRFGARLNLNGTPIIFEGLPFTNTSRLYTGGIFYLTGDKVMILNAGTYTVDLIGTLLAFDSNGIRATFGASLDQLDIIATPVH